MEPKYNGKCREFTIEDIKHIGQEVIKGTKIRTLAADYKTSLIRIKRILNFYTSHVVPRPGYKAIGIIQKTLGHKSIPYYETEEEIAEIPEYTWDSLTEIERKFYLKYEKRQEGCGSIDQTLE